MKSLSNLLAKGTLLCLALIPAALAGPGGSYGPAPTTPRGYGPTSSYDGGGFGGGFSHRGHDYYQPSTIYGPTRSTGTYKPSANIGDADDYPNRSYFDRDFDEQYRDGFDRDRRPVVIVKPTPTDRRPISAHRPSYYNGGWYHGDWHSNWNKSLKSRPYAWGGWGQGWNGWKDKPSGTVASSPWRFGYWSYSNPYYATNATGPAYFNYSQPIVASNITADVSGQFYPQAIGQTSREQALQIFAAARAAFFAGDLRTALSQIDQAIAVLPGDTVLHEFRALVLFGRRDYSAAAGTIYAVLSSGPGWDWTTMIGLYPNANIYTGQLRVLEDFCNANPGATHARFVLAYHYLTAGYADAAAEMYRQVLAINPRDALSRQLFASLTGTGAPQTAQLPQVGSQPISNQFLLGHWDADRDDGSRFHLDLRGNGIFTWTYEQYSQRQQLSGSYTLSDGLLVMQQDGQPALVGQIYPVGANRFVFRLTGGDPYDPGITFSR